MTAPGERHLHADPDRHLGQLPQGHQQRRLHHRRAAGQTPSPCCARHQHRHGRRDHALGLHQDHGRCLHHHATATCSSSSSPRMPVTSAATCRRCNERLSPDAASCRRTTSCARSRLLAAVTATTASDHDARRRARGRSGAAVRCPGRRQLAARGAWRASPRFTRLPPPAAGAAITVWRCALIASAAESGQRSLPRAHRHASSPGTGIVNSRKILLVFRGNVPIKTATYVPGVSGGTNGNPGTITLARRGHAAADPLGLHFDHRRMQPHRSRRPGPPPPLAPRLPSRRCASASPSSTAATRPRTSRSTWPISAPRT